MGHEKSHNTCSTIVYSVCIERIHRRTALAVTSLSHSLPLHHAVHCSCAGHLNGYLEGLHFLLLFPGPLQVAIQLVNLCHVLLLVHCQRLSHRALHMTCTHMTCTHMTCTHMTCTHITCTHMTWTHDMFTHTHDMDWANC